MDTPDITPIAPPLEHAEFAFIAKEFKKPTKAVAKLYFITNGGVNSDGKIFFGRDATYQSYRTKEELAKAAKALDVGEYTVMTASTKRIVVSDIRRVKGV